MAMNTSGERNGPVTEVNVTPLIDVLLVLLIIFMVITPLMPNGLDAQAPQSPEKQVKPYEGTIVVSLDSQHHLKINRDSILLGDLGPRLESIYRTRNERVVFVKGDPGASFGDVAAVIDVARGAGAERIGLITKAIEEGN